MNTEAMKLALEALIGARAFLESDAPVEIWGVNDKAITALREALVEQPAQQEYTSFAEWANDYVRANLHKLKPAQQEPVAWMEEMPTQEGETRSVRMTTLKEHATLEWGNPIPLYTSPPQRAWVDLTDDEVVHLKMLGRDLEFVSMTALRRFARDIQQTSKEKNV